jgi:hypothetical protein
MFKSWLAGAAVASAALVLAESGVAQVVKDPERDMECIGDSVHRCMVLRDLRYRRDTKRSCTPAGRAYRGRGGGL